MVIMCLSIVLRCEVEYYSQSFKVLLYIIVVVSLLLFVCVFVVCVMIVWCVCYTGTYDITDDFGV